MNLSDTIYNTVLFFLKGNRDFFKILSDFQDKLPPQQKRAQQHSNILPYAAVIDTTQMKMNLTTVDIDLFQKKLENFNYSRIFFKRKEIKSYSKNLQRLIKDAGWEKFGIALVQNLLEDEAFKNSKPYLFGYRIGRYLGY